MAIMLGVSRLLVMAKDTSGLCPIAINKLFFWLINCSIVLRFYGSFQEHPPPHQFGLSTFRGYKASFSTYIVIGRWRKLTLKTLLITFLKLLFLGSCVMSRGLWRTLSLLAYCFMVFILLFTTNMGDMWKGSPLLNHLHAQSKVTP